MPFVVKILTNVTRDSELHEMLHMRRCRKCSNALVHPFEFGYTKSVTSRINGFLSPHCSQKIPVTLNDKITIREDRI